MATTVSVLLDPVVTIATTDMSDQVGKIEISETTDDVDVKVFGGGAKTVRGGMYSASVKLTFVQGFAAVDAVLRPLLGTVAAFTAKPADAVLSAENPEFTGSLVVNQVGWGGGPGDPIELDVTFQVTGRLVKDITP